MSKNIVVITSSFRVNSNSTILADAFIQGASKDNNIKKIEIKNLNMKFCTGCLYCQKKGSCILDDDMNELYDTIQNADVLVFATPIYYYAVSGQMKTFLDRLNPLYIRNNKFKDVYLLAACADDEESACDGAIKDIEGWVSCFNDVRIAGIIKGLNVNNPKEILDSVAYSEAFKLGESIAN